jgi:competence ComEA-like helix-hairpin-helix protein
MWGLTKPEQRAALFLLAAFGAGCLLLFYRKQAPPPGLDARQAAVMAEFVRAARQDSGAGRLETAAADSTPATSLGKARNRVNLNTATFDDLMQLPGIGPVMARRILQVRADNGGFGRVEDLMRVKGIGRKRMAELEKIVTVE